MDYVLTKNKIPKRIQRIYWVWLEQRSRCSASAHPRWKTYGGKGIKVEYGSREFIEWYLANVPKVGKWHVGRIDHSKNYCFKNIEVQTPRENTQELHFRNSPNAKLDRKKVAQIRKFLIENPWQGAKSLVARALEVSPATITYLQQNKTWR